MFRTASAVDSEHLAHKALNDVLCNRLFRGNTSDLVSAFKAVCRGEFAYGKDYHGDKYVLVLLILLYYQGRVRIPVIHLEMVVFICLPRKYTAL